MPQISAERVRQIVIEELKLKQLREEVDHAGITNVVKLAGKLLDSIEKFDESASGKMKSATTPQLDQLKRVLEDMVSTPGSYVDVAPREPKIVSLRAMSTPKTDK